MDLLENYDHILSEGKRVEVQIGSLEKGIAGLKRQLEDMGLDVQMDVFKAGRGTSQHYGPSNVKVVVTARWKDEKGKDTSTSVRMKFVAGGYAVYGKSEFGGGDGLRVMKAKAMKYVMDKLTLRGWTKP